MAADPSVLQPIHVKCCPKFAVECLRQHKSSCCVIDRSNPSFVASAMRVLLAIFMAAASSLMCGCSTLSSSPSVRSPPVSYSPVSRASLKRLSLRQTTLDDSSAARIRALARTNSPWGSRWAACEPADMTRGAPWTTRLYIFTGEDVRHCVEIEARDHANGGATFEWLNDRVLFVRCWWGRIVSTDFILDAETTRLIYIQDANYLSSVLPP